MKMPSSSGASWGALVRGVAVGVMVTGMSAACGDVGPERPESTESSSAATIVCGQDTVHGMDVSHYDGTITWATAKANGIDFAIAKATESTTYVDPTFAANWAGMKAAGVVRGAYHFFRANADPVAQANHFVQTVGALEAGDLPLVLDLETADGQSGATIGANAVKFLDAVTAATGKTAIVYTSPGFITGTIGTPPAGIGRYTLWVANWGVSCPNVPGPWSTWAFWQRSATGTVPGVPATAVDLNTFNGTLAQLHAFGGSPVSDGGTTSDAGSNSDAGGGTRDGGTTGDAASGSDSATPGADGGIAHADGGGGGGAGDASTGGDSTFNATGESAGCTVGRGAGTSRSVWLLALFGVIAVRARRRRR